MASIFTRTDKTGVKRYYGSIYHNNLRIRRYLGLTKKSAELALKKLEYAVLFNNYKADKKPEITFNQAFMSYLKNVERSGIQQKQVKVIGTKVKWFRDYCFAQRIYELEDISKKLAHQYIISRQINSPRPSTLNKEIGFIKRFFNHCIDMEWLDRNPFRTVKYVKDDIPTQRYFFTTKDLTLIMQNPGKYIDFFIFLLKTGIRSTDVFNLSPEHLKGNSVVKQMNKTGDWLNIPIPTDCIDILNKRNNHSLYFPELQTAFQRKICTKHLQSNFEPDFVRTNNINLHTFRHTYAHNMLNKGVPKEVLQTLLGHRSIKTTEIYANWVRKEELERWV